MAERQEEKKWLSFTSMNSMKYIYKGTVENNSEEVGCGSAQEGLGMVDYVMDSGEAFSEQSDSGRAMVMSTGTSDRPVVQIWFCRSLALWPYQVTVLTFSEPWFLSSDNRDYDCTEGYNVD